MYRPETHLFCCRLKMTANGLVKEGSSPRYTIMTLLGLLKSESSGMKNPFNNQLIFDALTKDLGWLSNIGDLGLLLWLCSLISPARYSRVWEETQAGSAFNRYPEVAEGRTMDLSWFLAGLSHARMVGLGDAQALKGLSFKVFELLLENQGRSGLFGHRSRKGIFSSWRGWLGSFADQIYPIYAFSVFGQAFGLKAALEAASACADTLCGAQGPLGQWWWHYDSPGGRVVGHYPVYSVHQDGMAPMGLFALGKATGKDYSTWVNRGLQWIFGDNELGQNLCEDSMDVIWRSIFLPRVKTYSKEAGSILRLQTNSGVPHGLRIRHECRPYHLGWLLYAFGDYESA